MPSFPEYVHSPYRCLECGKLLGAGRHDRKFCSPDCKNRYHNRRRYATQVKAVTRITKILLVNRDILARLVRMGIRNIDRVTLVHMGFNPDYSTSYQCKSSRHQVYTCFDFTYELTPSRVKDITRMIQEQQEGVRRNRSAFTSERPSSEDL